MSICFGCGKEIEKLETQLDGNGYCSTDCFMKYNKPCEQCGNIVPYDEGVHYKEKGHTLCWDCATGVTTEQNKSVWEKIKSGDGSTAGYLEKFVNSSGVAMSVPGSSRWIDGETFDLSKAKLID